MNELSGILATERLSTAIAVLRGLLELDAIAQPTPNGESVVSVIKPAVEDVPPAFMIAFGALAGDGNCGKPICKVVAEGKAFKVVSVWLGLDHTFKTSQELIGALIKLIKHAEDQAHNPEFFRLAVSLNGHGETDEVASGPFPGQLRFDAVS